MKKKMTVFGANAKDNDIRYNSSSGGVFSVLAEEVLNIGGVICGAALSDDCKSLAHVIIDDTDGLERLRKSKYFQSQMGDTYGKINTILNNGRTVLFSGTPCQIAGLKLFLGREYANLLTVEVVCHGVPSSGLWKKYVEWEEKRYDEKIKDVDFRSKKQSWVEFGIDKKLDDGKYIYNHHRDDLFFALFLENCCLRPSCYSCRTKIVADISLGDLWGIEEIAPTLNDDKGTSLVLLNTKKGKDYWERIQHKIVFQEIVYEKALKNNICIEESVFRPMSRDTFFNDMKKMPFEKLAYKYRYTTFKAKVKYLMRFILLKKFNKGKNGI